MNEWINERKHTFPLIEVMILPHTNKQYVIALANISTAKKIKSKFLE